MLALILVLRYLITAKRVSFNNIGSRVHIHLVHLGNHLRRGQVQNVVVAFEHHGVVFELAAAEIGLGQAEFLDAGAHCAVQNQDALFQSLSYCHYLMMFSTKFNFKIAINQSVKFARNFLQI